MNFFANILFRIFVSMFMGKIGLLSFFFFFFRFFFFYFFIYWTEIETASERGNTSRGSGRERSRLPVEEPDAGLDPRTLGSCPEPQADT